MDPVWQQLERQRTSCGLCLAGEDSRLTVDTALLNACVFDMRLSSGPGMGLLTGMIQLLASLYKVSVQYGGVLVERGPAGGEWTQAGSSGGARPPREACAWKVRLAHCWQSVRCFETCYNMRVLTGLTGLAGLPGQMTPLLGTVECACGL
jgi:hypothetical protein